MMNLTCSFVHLSNQALLTEVKRLVQHECHATALLISSLMELDSRRLYLGEGCSSLFTYCTQVLHLSEHAAYSRIEAARAARRFPLILDLLAEGAVSLTVVGLLAPHLTSDNHRELLEDARHKSKRDVEHLIAGLHPLRDVPSSIRKLPVLRPSGLVDTQAVEARRNEDRDRLAVVRPSKAPAVLAPLAPERYKIQFTVGRETYEKLRRAQDLLRHTIRNGDPAAVFDRALTVLLAELDSTRLARTTRPRKDRPAAAGSRHIPATVKRAVWTRDGGRCAFIGTIGRCNETGLLQFHHVVPYATGGQAVVENIQLRCAAHNAYEAELHFGPPQQVLLRESAPAYTLEGRSLRRRSVASLRQELRRLGPDRVMPGSGYSKSDGLRSSGRSSGHDRHVADRIRGNPSRTHEQNNAAGHGDA